MMDSSGDSCLFCGQTGHLKRCMRCRVARYCCKEHQVQHWKVHKVHCSKSTTDSHPSSHAPIGTASPAPVSSKAESKTATKADDWNGEPFDDRPLRLTDFEKPKSDRDEDRMAFCVERMKSDGFCVLDNVMTPKECKRVMTEIKELESSGKMIYGKLAGGRASCSKDDMVVNPNIRGDKMVWIEENELNYPAIKNLISNRMDAFVLPLTAHFDGEFMLSGRTKAMVACYPGEGRGYRRHVDNPTKDGRIVTCIFYFNSDWDSEKSGGVLRIFPTSKPGDYVDIAPVMNRMLLFWSDGRTPHEVRPAYATRYAITMWYFNAKERAKAKETAVNTAISETEKQLADVQLKTKAVEKEILEKKVAATTTSAINMLTEEELEALTHMVSVSADPKALLTQLGIAPVLQDNLLKTIHERSKTNCNITVLDDL